MLRGTRWGRLALCADLTPTLMPQPFTSRAASGRASLTALLLAGGLCALTAAPAVAQPAPAASSPTAPAAAGPLRERLKERLEQRRTERNAPEGDDEGPDELSDLGGRSGGAALSCADWSKRVERLSKLPRFKAASGPKPDLADVPYGPLERERLDVFRAKGPAGSPPAPVIVMVHGGGWCVGDKAMAGVTANKVARWTPKGLMLVSVNYPMVGDGYGAVGQAQAIAQALAFVQKQAAAWGGDPSRVILMGHSAGAHLVSLVNAEPDLRIAAGAQMPLATVSIDAGAIDVVKQMPQVYPFLKLRYEEAFGTLEPQWMGASPWHRLVRGASPWLGICSTTRKDDPCGQARAYVEKSLGLGIHARALPQAKSHAALNNELGQPGAYTDSVERFLAGTDHVVARLLGAP